MISDISLSNDKENHPNDYVTSNYDSNIKVFDIREEKLRLILEKKKKISVIFNGINIIISGNMKVQ